jgi:hypothetical protein
MTEDKNDWKTSTDPEARQRRIRAGIEEGWYPVTHSRMARYQLCPRFYRYEYEDKLPRPGGPSADLGTLAHQYSEIVANDGYDAAAAIARITIPFDKRKEFLAIKNVIDAIELKRDFLYESEYTVHRTWSVLRKRDNATLTVQYEGRIDLLFLFPERHMVEVIDGKSGRNVGDVLSDDPQGASYLSAVRESFADLDLHSFLFTQAQWRMGRLVTVEFTEEDLDIYDRQMRATTEQMVNDNEFKPRPGAHCHWCPYSLRCDVGQRFLGDQVVNLLGREVGIYLTDYEDAVRLASVIPHLEAQVKRLKDALKGYVRDNQVDRLQYDGGYWAMKPVEKREWIGGLDELLKENPELADLIKTSYYSYLEHYKKT